MRAHIVLVPLGFVLLAALALRWPIASHDVEHYIGPDEGEVVENVLEMMKTGDFDPRHPGYPGLHFYIQLVPLTAHLLHSRFERAGATIAELPRSGFYETARRTTLVAGLLAALVTFLAGRRFLTPWGALLAASLLALSPLSFRESAVVNPDLMLSLFASLALLLSLRLVERGEERSRSRFLLAGAGVGLATAVKYTGAFTVLAYGVAWALGPKSKARDRDALFGLAAGAAAFALVSPYTFLHAERSLRGLAMHVGYYEASDRNAALELLRVLATRGLGPVAAIAATLGALRTVAVRDPRRLVVVSYPLLYLLVFAWFERAFPRHALPLLPALALLSADAVEWLTLTTRHRSKSRLLSVGLVVSMIAPLFWGSFDLFSRSRRATPADRAAVWASSTLPAGARVLEDQFTPSLDDRFRVHRLRVEERVFVGDFDWVLYSGYPPGIDRSGLREVTRFETDGALGDTIFAYQVPGRASLMGVSLPRESRELEIGAGELPYFGEGWDPPEPGAYGTTRLSRGAFSEIFVVLPGGPGGPGGEDSAALSCEMTVGAAVPGGAAPVELEVEVNGERVATFAVASEAGETFSFDVPASLWKSGLNRIVLRYPTTARLDRRHREAAVWFSRLRLSRS